MALILGIESTCDETAAAFVEDGRHVLGQTIASQVDLHAIYRGVVPEIASRAHIENLLPTLARTVEAAGHELADADAIAVAHRPGLIGSLVIGLTAAKTLAWALSKPLIGVDHVHAHLYSVLLDNNVEPELPAVGLVVSGGHTALYLVRSWTSAEPLGRTIDDAVGEAYDKVASILNLGYPGGPIIDHLASQGDAKAVQFPRAMLGRSSLDFSFSGLKTAVLYHVRPSPQPSGRRVRASFAGALQTGDASALSEREVRDVCASFQAACVDTLIRKLRRAIQRTGARSVIVGGGVSANTGLRGALGSLGLPAYLPALQYCTDNAAMTAGLADVLLREGHVSGLELDAETQTAI